ncbi:MAG: hypothetical protein ACREFQ_23065 [Stellaceae bacterium]
MTVHHAAGIMIGRERERELEVPGPSSGERRRSKRHTSQQVVLTFLGIDHVALNWSMGGVLVAEHYHPALALGTAVSGVLTIRGLEGRFRFAAELVRRDARTKELAFRFVNPSRALLDALTRVSV